MRVYKHSRLYSETPASSTIRPFWPWVQYWVMGI